MNLTKFFRRVFQFMVVLLTFYILLALVGTGFVTDEINKAENEQAIIKRF